MFNTYHICNRIAGLVLAVLLRLFYTKEQEMRLVRFKHVSPEDYGHLIDMYFKLEMKHVLEKIIYAHSQGSFNITLVKAA